jgi:hypothetical protein
MVVLQYGFGGIMPPSWLLRVPLSVQVVAYHMASQT